MRQNIYDIPELDRKGLREFGLVTGAIVAGLFGLFFPWLLEVDHPVWPWWIAGLLAIWALVAPESLRTVYQLWMRFGLLLNRVTTPIVIGFIFFLVITPMAFIMRVIGRDPLARRFDDQVKSYRTVSKKAPKSNMEKPF